MVGAALAQAVKKDPLVVRQLAAGTPDDLVPPDDAAKRAELARVARLLTPGVRAALSDEDRASLDKLLGAAGEGPITPRSSRTCSRAGCARKTAASGARC